MVGLSRRSLIFVAMAALALGLVFPLSVVALTTAQEWTYRTELQCVQVRASVSLNRTVATVNSLDENWLQADCAAHNSQPAGELRARDNLHVFSQTTGNWSVCESWDAWFMNPSADWQYPTATTWNYPCGRNRTYACSCAGQVWHQGAWRDQNKIFVWSGGELWK